MVCDSLIRLACASFTHAATTPLMPIDLSLCFLSSPPLKVCFCLILPLNDSLCRMPQGINFFIISSFFQQLLCSRRIYLCIIEVCAALPSCKTQFDYLYFFIHFCNLRFLDKFLYVDLFCCITGLLGTDTLALGGFYRCSLRTASLDVHGLFCAFVYFSIASIAVNGFTNALLFLVLQPILHLANLFSEFVI